MRRFHSDFQEYMTNFIIEELRKRQFSNDHVKLSQLREYLLTDFNGKGTYFKNDEECWAFFTKYSEGGISYIISNRK